MKNTAKALNEFYNGFGIPAYPSDSVPDDAQRPYITYLVARPEWNRPATHYCRVWYRGIKNIDLFDMADMIVRTIGQGIKIKCPDGGYLAIYPETPLQQLMVSDDPTDRSVYINLQLNAYNQ